MENTTRMDRSLVEKALAIVPSKHKQLTEDIEELVIAVLRNEVSMEQAKLALYGKGYGGASFCIDVARVVRHLAQEGRLKISDKK